MYVSGRHRNRGASITLLKAWMLTKSLFVGGVTEKRARIARTRFESTRDSAIISSVVKVNTPSRAGIVRDPPRGNVVRNLRSWIVTMDCRTVAMSATEAPRVWRNQTSSCA